MFTHGLLRVLILPTSYPSKDSVSICTAESMEVYFRSAHRGDDEAKFMTASDILGRLKLWGNIEHAMPINKFGQLLQKRGFVKTKYQGKPGYVVVENSTPSQSQKVIAKEILDV